MAVLKREISPAGPAASRTISSQPANPISFTPAQYGVAFGAVGSLSDLSQTLTTIPGQTYTVSFWLNSNGQSPDEVKLSWGGTTIFDQSNIPDIGWTQHSFLETALSSSTLLDFGLRQDSRLFRPGRYFGEHCFRSARTFDLGDVVAGLRRNWSIEKLAATPSSPVAELAAVMDLRFEAKLQVSNDFIVR